ncbi:hypothetical protein LTR53_019189, partial [Teratosphaeriaceae sp. CCFEE 6253]
GRRLRLRQQHEHRPHRLRRQAMRRRLPLLLPGPLRLPGLPQPGLPARRQTPAQSARLDPDPHPVRHRPGALLPHPARPLRAHERPAPEDQPHPVQVPDRAAGAGGQDVGLGSQLGDLHVGFARADQEQDQQARLLRRAGERGGAPQAGRGPGRGCRIHVP